MPGESPERLRPVDPRRLRLGGEIGRRIEITTEHNLLNLDLDGDFLRPFRERTAHDGYIGLGKLLETAVRLAACPGDPRVLAWKQRLTAAVIAAQEPDGYLGQLAPPGRITHLWDIHEQGYLIHALAVDHQLHGATASLAAARRAADYVIARWPDLPADWGERTGVAPWVAVIGLERALLRLHQETGEPRYLDFVLGPRALADWDPAIVIGRRPGIEGHIYAYLARCLAQLELHRRHPDPRLLRPARRALDFLTRHDGLTVSGAAGQWEIWTDDQDGRRELGETCATAYQLRVFDRLLRLTGRPLYGDLIERTVFNTLFAAQSPDGRRIRYFTPLEGERCYHPGDTYCCPCNYRRIVAELPEMVYYTSARGLVVNLYTASHAHLTVRGQEVALEQLTDYPSQGEVALRVEPAGPLRFELRLRIPAWAGRAEVAVNGDRSEAEPGTFHRIDREWRPGDRVTLELPMPWRLVRGRQRQAGRVAVLRGPQLFCLNPEQSRELAGQDGADLGCVTLDPGSLAAPVADDRVRPGGVACRVAAWRPGGGLAPVGELTLDLTEFADPGGQATYFRLRDLGPAVEDELLSGAAQRSCL